MHYKTLINKTFCLMLLMALFMPWQTKAQETLTLYENETGTSNKSSIYWFYFDAFSRAQTVFPASDLADMDGGTITAIKFYTSFTSAYTSDKNVDVYLAEVASTSISSFVALANTTNVYHGTISLVLVDGKAQVTIELATPYEYHGGNLLFGCDNEEKGTYKNVSFYGKTTSGASVYGSGSSYGGATATQSNFLPKTTFTYTVGCAKPASVTTGNITSNSATINWAGGSGTYNIEYKTATETDWTSKASDYSGNSINLTSLESGTSYQARVQSVCEEGKLSNWVSVDFSTLCVPTDNFPFSENFDGLTSGIPMCWDNSEGTTTNDNYKWNYHETGHNGKCVRFNSYNNSNGLTNFLKTRAMNLPAGQTMQVCFWYKNPTGGDFSIYLSDDGGTTHTTVLATELTGQTEWTEMEIAFPNDYIGKDNVVVVFKGTSNCGYGDAYIYLDDVIVEPQPTCPKPTELHTNEITARTAKLQWTPGSSDQNHWELYLTQSQTDEPNNDTPASTGYDNITENPFTLHSLTPEATYYAYVRANCGGGDKSKWSLVCPFTMEPSCYQPTNLQTPLVTSSSVELQWSITSEPDSYDILITQDASLVPNENTQPSKSGITEHPYTYDEDIQPQATYYAFVRANCGSTDGYSPWSNRVTFTTPCEANTVFPFTENFDNLTTNGQIPNCWDNEEHVGSGMYGNSHYEWCYSSSNGAGYSGKCVRFESEYNNKGNINYLKTPLMNFPAGKPMQLRFWYKNATGGDFSVYISTDGGQTHSTALAQSLPNVSSWTEKEIPLPSDYIGGQNIVIVFKGTSNYKSGGVILLDDVTIEEAPSCNFPRNLTLTGFSGINPILGWTAYGTETQWQISYSTTSGDHNTIAEAGSNPFTLTGLNPQTKYYVSVRAKCSETEHSAWSDEISFNTPQTPVTVDAQHPFNDGFEGNECGWLLENGNLTNQWHWGSVASNSGNGIYISDDGGVTNHYSNSATFVYATKTFTFSEGGTYLFKYDWKAQGHTNYDFIHVFLVPVSVEIAASSSQSGVTYLTLPQNWEAIVLEPLNDQGKEQALAMGGATTWHTESIEKEIPIGTYKMVFMWRTMQNNYITHTQPPAAIDNVHISLVSCAQPTELTVTAQARTATVTWNAGNDSQWQVAYGTVSGEPDENTFQTVTAATCSFSGLTPETDYYAFVRTVCGEGNYSEWSEQSFTTTEACPAPTNLTYSNVGPYTAAVSWTAGATGQTAWNLQYKKHNDSQWSETIEINNAAAYQLTGLSAITSYDVQVQAVCGGEDGASEWLTRTNLFTTDCGAIDLHYECGFEGPNVSIQGCLLPKCWSVKPYTTTNNEKYPKVASSGSNAVARTGTYCLKFHKTSSISDEMAILPEINKDLSLVQLRFWARINSSSTNSPDLHIVVLNDPENTSNYTEVANVKVNSDVYTEYTIRLDNYSGNGRYLAILCKAGDTYLTSFFVDDLLVEEIPNCSVPQNLSANALSSSQTLITWGPGAYETQWQLEVTAEGGTPETVTVNSVPFHTLTTMSNTIYSVRVRSVCGSDFYSEWTEPITFRTPCDEITTVDAQHPFFEDFNGEAFPPDCWTINNEKYNGSTGSGWFRSVNNNMDNHGVAVSYWYGNTYLIMPRMHISGDAKISFDQYFMANDDPIASRVVISTDGMSYSNFTEIWSASEAPTSVTNVTIPLPAAYQDQDVYIAFKFGNNDETERDLSQQYREWFIDNVEVYVGDIQRVELTQGWNWWSPTVETSLEQLEAALGDKGVTIKAQNGKFANYEDDEWDGNLTTIIPGQMYKIQVNNNCEFVLSGIALSSVSIIIEQGQNWIGHTSMQVVSINQAFNNFTPVEGDRITSFDGKFTSYEDGEWSGTLTQLQPGQGYVYISQDTNSKTLIINEN